MSALRRTHDVKAPAKKGKPARAMAAPAAVPTGHDPEMMKYRARDAIDTLKRAEEIKADPVLMKHVKAHAVEQRNHLNKVIRRKT